jgi:hypothetical protein
VYRFALVYLLLEAAITTTPKRDFYFYINQSIWREKERERERANKAKKNRILHVAAAACVKPYKRKKISGEAHDEMKIVVLKRGKMCERKCEKERIILRAKPAYKRISVRNHYKQKHSTMPV